MNQPSVRSHNTIWKIYCTAITKSPGLSQGTTEHLKMKVLLVCPVLAFVSWPDLRAWPVLSENKWWGFLIRGSWFLAAGFGSHVFLLFKTAGYAE